MKPPKRLPIHQEDGTVKIPLTLGLYAVIDAEDLPLLGAREWRASKERHGYYALRSFRLNGKSHIEMMHRAIMKPEPGMVCDHIDGDGLNNRRSNLRVCSQAENVCNARLCKSNRLRLKGVCIVRSTGKFKAQIRHGGRKLGLGYYVCPILAYVAYCRASRKYHGEFSNSGFTSTHAALQHAEKETK